MATAGQWKPVIIVVVAKKSISSIPELNIFGSVRDFDFILLKLYHLDVV